MLEHADRHDAIERPGNVAIILEQEFGRMGQVLFGGAGVRHLQLLGRKRDAGDVGAGHFSQIETKAAPAGADVEHAVAGVDQKLGGDMAFLGKLGFVKARIRRLEIGAAILLVGIEEERIEPAVEIVMARDIVPRATAWIELLGVPDQVSQPPLQLGPARQDIGLAEQDRQRIRDRTLFDDECPLHVDLAQREFWIEQDSPFGVGGEESDGYRFAGAIATGKTGPARGRERHRPAANELRQKVTQQTVHRNHRNKRSRRKGKPPAATTTRPER